MGERYSFQPILAISHLLDSSNSSGCELISPGFEFPWLLQLLSIFSCVYWPSVQLLYRNVYWTASAIYSTGLSFYWAITLLYIFWLLVPDHIHMIHMICKHILPSLGCLFTVSKVSFEAQKFSILNKPNLSYFLSFLVWGVNLVYFHTYTFFIKRNTNIP